MSPLKLIQWMMNSKFCPFLSSRSKEKKKKEKNANTKLKRGNKYTLDLHKI